MRLARQRGLNHPQDWVRVFDSHTSYEWDLQLALDKIEPCGERRDDMRMAWLATAIIANNRTEKMSERELKNLADAIAHYLVLMNPVEDE